MDRMGIYSLLDAEDMASFRKTCTKRIENLTERQGKNAKTIFDTAEVYFDTGESLNDTAKALNIHVNTVKYRIDKLRENLGSAYFDGGREKLSFHLLLKMRKIL
jgi:purine catabolism regulator